MKSNLQQSNGLEALFKSTRQHIFLKIRSKPFPHVFSIVDLAKWSTRITKIWFVNWIPRTNEATRLISLPPNSAQKCFVSLRVVYSIPVEHELVAQSWYPRCCFCLERAHPVRRSARGAWLRQKSSQRTNFGLPAELGDKTIRPKESIKGVWFLTDRFHGPSITKSNGNLKMLALIWLRDNVRFVNSEDQVGGHSSF
jgi:hypothetical protein